MNKNTDCFNLETVIFRKKKRCKNIFSTMFGLSMIEKCNTLIQKWWCKEFYRWGRQPTWYISYMTLTWHWDMDWLIPWRWREERPIQIKAWDKLALRPPGLMWLVDWHRTWAIRKLRSSFILLEGASLIWNLFKSYYISTRNSQTGLTLGHSLQIYLPWRESLEAEFKPTTFRNLKVRGGRGSGPTGLHFCF